MSKEFVQTFLAVAQKVAELYRQYAIEQNEAARKELMTKIEVLAAAFEPKAEPKVAEVTKTAPPVTKPSGSSKPK